MSIEESRTESAGDSANAPAVRPSRWRKFRMVAKTVELRLRFIALMAATALVFAYWDTLWNYYEKYTRPQTELAAVSAHEYFCPMHPSVIQDHAGNCPICGMPLSRRKKGEKTSLPEGVVARVQLAPFRVAQAGIRTVSPSFTPLSESLTTVGSVAFDERRFARISSRIKGMSRIEKLSVNYTGQFVEVGEALAEVYSPELYQAVRELLLAQERSRTPSTAPASPLGRSLLGGPDDLVQVASEKLKLWGITPAQIDRILTTKKAEPRMPIESPICGTVVRKNVVEGQYVAEGDTLFEIADLSHVWILAQVYEDQVSLVKVGQHVEATVEAHPGVVFKGRVAFTDPALNPATRTMSVRYDLDNPDGKLQPGMYATVTLRTAVEETPRTQTRVAAAGASPAQLKATASPTVDEQKICPVTRAKLGSMGEPIPVQLASRKVWVCCSGCPDALKREPDKYLPRLDAPANQGVLSVPETAVIDTGNHKIVYVETEPGVFEGRKVVLGSRIGDRFPVIEGLTPDDKVAASGAFLIDAESRLNQGPLTAPSETAGGTATSVKGAHQH